MEKIFDNYWDEIVSTKYYHSTNSVFIDSIKKNGLRNDIFLWNEDHFENLVNYHVKAKGELCFIARKCIPYCKGSYLERKLWLTSIRSIATHCFSSGILPEVILYLLNGAVKYFDKESFVSKDYSLGLFNNYLNLIDNKYEDYVNIEKLKLKDLFENKKNQFYKIMMEKSNLTKEELIDFEKSYSILLSDFIGSHAVVLHISRNADLLLAEFTKRINKKMGVGLNLDVRKLFNDREYFEISCKRITQNINSLNELGIAAAISGILKGSISLKGVIKPSEIIRYEVYK